MSYKALYREYRPQTFSEVVGQTSIVATLKNSILNNRIAHAYLFCGPRGTGKTTIAKLFAKSVNCNNFNEEPCNNCDNCLEITQGTHPDVIEIDAASNNSVDNIRDIIEKVKYAPLRAKYKVYIIDEVHMLTQGAFNALLKTLEEPPAHVIFILATTEPLKVPSTIISRCQRYDFGRISDEDLLTKLKEVAEKEKINVDTKALKLISRLAAGGMRDALSILDQCISYSSEHITSDNVAEIYGLVPVDELVDLLILVKENNPKEIFANISGYWKKGVDIQKLTFDLITITKEAAVYGALKDAELLSRINVEEAQRLNTKISSSELLSLVDLFIDTLGKYKVSENSSSYFEVAMLKAIQQLNSKMIQTPIENKKPDSDKKVKPVSTTSEEKEIETEQTIKNEEPLTTDNNEKGIKMYNTTKDIEDKLNVLGISGIKPESFTDNVSRETSKYTPKEDINIDNDILLGVLVRANKQYKNIDQEKWAKIKNYENTFEFARYARMFIDSNIVASSDDSIIVSVLTKEIANEINQSCDDDSITKFILKLLEDDKYLIAITKDEERELIKLYRNRKEEGTLPKAEAENRIKREHKKAVKKETEEEIEVGSKEKDVEEEKDESVEKLNELFGKNNFDIIE